MKSNCEHYWVKDHKSDVEVCVWCGLPKVRTSAPRPVMKLPPRVAEPHWASRKYKGTK